MKHLWLCPRCGVKLVLYVTPAEPPTCDCRQRMKGKKEPVAMKRKDQQ